LRRRKSSVTEFFKSYLLGISQSKVFTMQRYNYKYTN
jgi:hypothetical protein